MGSLLHENTIPTEANFAETDAFERKTGPAQEKGYPTIDHQNYNNTVNKYFFQQRRTASPPSKVTCKDDDDGIFFRQTILLSGESSLVHAGTDSGQG
jgi:hypothetical protein